MTTYYNATALLNGAFVKNTSVTVEDGRIVSVGKLTQGDVDLNGDYLLPGFVDVHIHAFMGRDTMEGESAIRHMSRELKKVGVAAFLPTTMSASPEGTIKALRGIRAVMDRPEENGAIVLGAHMEAPFLNPEKCGAQLKEYFMLPTMENFEKVTGEYGDCVRMITMAPELDGAEEFIRQMTRRGVKIAVGHSCATAAQTHKAADAGANQITHLFNAQTPLLHREPGVPGAGLADSRMYVQLICDGIHLHRDVVVISALCKGDHAVLITDAMEAAGMPDGKYQLGGQDVYVKNGAARLESGVLAGSTLTMKKGLTNLIGFGIAPAQAAQMGTAFAARSIDNREYGVLAPGAAACLNRFAPDWALKEVLA